MMRVIHRLRQCALLRASDVNVIIIIIIIIVVIMTLISARASRKLLKMELEVCTRQLFPCYQHYISAKDSTFGTEKGIQKSPLEPNASMQRF